MSEEINWQSTYNAAMDSVNLLNAGKPAGDSDEDWASEYDLAPFNAAIAANA
jgi:hypothetical protein